MVEEELLSVQIPGEAPDPVVHGDDIGVKGPDEVIQGGQWRDLPAGSHVDVHPEGGQAGLRMILRIGMDGDVAFIQMGDLCLAARGHKGPLRNQEGHRRALRIVVLPGDI